MQSTHAIRRAAAAHRQISHIETFRLVMRIHASQCKQIMERDAELILGIASQTMFKQCR